MGRVDPFIHTTDAITLCAAQDTHLKCLVQVLLIEQLHFDVNSQSIIISAHYFASRYWDTSKRVLLEKSPPNIVKTRFMQAMFGPAHSVFLVLTRHPVAAAYHDWRVQGLHDCGRRYIEHWLRLHDALRVDVPYLHTVHGATFEQFVASPDIYLNTMCTVIGVSPTDLPLINSSSSNNNDNSINNNHINKSRSHNGRRDLQGSHSQLIFEQSLAYEWIDPFLDVQLRDSAICAAVVRDFEGRLNYYGYSMADPTRQLSSQFIIMDVNT